MNVYNGINAVTIKDGRIYFFNGPQAGQSFSEIYAVLDEIKAYIQEIEKKQTAEAQKEENKKESKEAQAPNKEE